MSELKNLTIHQRIRAIMSEVNYIQKGDKTAVIGPQKYNFVSHDQVAEIIQPKFVKYGIVCIPSVVNWTQDGNRTSILLNVKFINTDDPKDFIENNYLGFGVDGGDKGPGKATSYAFKYAILKTFCLETGDDPDQDQNIKFEKSKPTSKEDQKGTDKITEQQFRELSNLLADCSIEYRQSVSESLKKLKEPIENLRDLKIDLFERLKIAAIKNKESAITYV